jgi:hypothetical protein
MQSWLAIFDEIYRMGFIPRGLITENATRLFMTVALEVKLSDLILRHFREPGSNSAVAAYPRD